jgi:uncharacterized protein
VIELTSKRIGAFLALTFGLDWTLALIFFATGKTLEDKLFFPMALIYMITPAVMAVVVQKLIFKEAVVKPLAIHLMPNRWFAVAWFIPPVMAIVILLLGLVIPGVQFSIPATVFIKKIFLTISIGTAITAVFAFGEELGWRGLLWHELKHLGFWKCSTLI